MVCSPRWIAGAIAFGLGSVVNPAYFGCASESVEKFEFGEAEMLELLDEANATGPFEFEDGTDRYRLEVIFTQKPGDDSDESASSSVHAPFAARAYACGSRSFKQSASACITSSTVPLTAQLDLFRLDVGGETHLVRNQTFDAMLNVFGTKLNNASIGIVPDDPEIATALSLSVRDKTFELTRFRIVATDLLVDWSKTPHTR